MLIFGQNSCWFLSAVSDSSNIDFVILIVLKVIGLGVLGVAVVVAVRGRVTCKTDYLRDFPTIQLKL